MFADLISPVAAGPGSSALGTERVPLTGTDVIPGFITSIQSQFSFVLSGRDSASGTSRFQVDIPPPIVPEPSSLTLLSLGAIGLVIRKRRRRRSNGV